MDVLILILFILVCIAYIILTSPRLEHEKCFVKRNGEVSGPFPMEKVSELVESGWLSEFDLIRFESSPRLGWIPLGLLPGVKRNKQEDSAWW
jgi:hypothetical protein